MIGIDGNQLEHLLASALDINSDMAITCIRVSFLDVCELCMVPFDCESPVWASGYKNIRHMFPWI